MRAFSLYIVELKRLLKSRAVLLVMAVTAASPLAGFFLYRALMSNFQIGYSASINSTYIGNPVLMGTLIAAVIFGILTVLERDKVHRTGSVVLTESVISPVLDASIGTLAMLSVAVMAWSITVLLWLPFTLFKVGSIFRLELYFSFYLVIMLFGILFSVLFSSAAYNISRRLDLSLVLLILFVILSLVIWQDNWLLRWINPSVMYILDDFSSARLLRSLFWNRLFWTLVLTGFFMLSLLCVRRYGKGILGSARQNIKKAYIPALAVILVAAGCFSYVFQPLIDDSKKEIDDSFYDINYNEAVSYSSTSVEARPNLYTGEQFGTAKFMLSNEGGKPETISFEINPGYEFTRVTANGSPAAFRDMDNDDHNRKTIEVDLPESREIELIIEYGGFPQEWNIISLGQGMQTEISRESLYLTHQDFAPMPHDIMPSGNERAEFMATIPLPDYMTPVMFGTGTVTKTATNPDGTNIWLINDKARSAMLYAGDYVSEKIDAAGLNVEFYYSAKHRRVMEEYNINGVIKQVFEYCTENYGPLQFYMNDTLRLIEGGAGGGYAGRGSSLMGEDSFNEEGLKDKNKGAKGSEVLAHEIVHQWWGLGNMFSEDDPYGPWSSEGLTVYTTYRMMKEQHGDEYANKEYVARWQQEVDNYKNNFYVRNPQYLELLPEKYRVAIENSVSGMRHYSEMPLKILKAEGLVGGEDRMDEILYNLFNREMDYNSPYLTYEDFLTACSLTKEDLEL